MGDERDAPGIDMHRVLIEIDEEVRSKRASGELTVELERELDMVFARLAPPGAVAGDFGQLLDRAESQAYFDLVAPNDSVRPGVPYVKRVVQKTVRWYLRYVAEQITGFAHTMTKLVRDLNERVTIVEQLTIDRAETAAVRSPTDASSSWFDEIADALSGVDGRVLHARCGRGELVERLRAENIDSYGVDAAADLIAEGTARQDGPDLRPDDEREHLRLLAPGALGGLVLSGIVDCMPRGAQVELADLASTVLRRGGVLVIATTHPDVWERAMSPVEADLSPGRPMHVQTWIYLLEERGFTVSDLVQAGPTETLQHVEEGPNAGVVNANIDRLNALLFPPSSSLLVAQR